MARGWESKSVEEQQSEARSPAENAKHRLTEEQKKLINLHAGWTLDKKRIQQQLAAAKNPRHREMLQAALADLESKLQQPK
jgi:hypothetical protein